VAARLTEAQRAEREAAKLAKAEASALKKSIAEHKRKIALIHHECCAWSGGPLSLEMAWDPCTCPENWPRTKSGKVYVPKVKGAPKAAPKVPNPCLDAPRLPVEVATNHYALRMDFAPSNAQLTRYCEFHKYKMVMNWETESGYPAPTFDETALSKLMESYPRDPLFPLIQRYRQIEKCKGTYVDGIYINEASRVCGEFLHTPKTGRLSMKGAPHQLQPRTSDPQNPFYRVREMYIAAAGHRLMELDFGGIEAVLTMYLAGVHDDGTAKVGCEDARLGLRLTGIDIHGYLSSYDIGQPADPKWSDADLRDYLALFRKENRQWRTKSGLMRLYEDIRDCNKTGLYGSLYGGGPGTLVRSRPEIFPNDIVAGAVQGLIFDLFPSVRTWWWEVCMEADQRGYVRTPDGYRQYFNDVLVREFSKSENRWKTKMSRLANECIAAKPQHLAMCYTAQGLDLFWERHRDLAEGLRLTIHDSVVGEWHEDVIRDVYAALKGCMETPLPFLPLPAEWGMGSHLKVAVDGKWSAVGGNWREMSKIKL